MGRFEELAERQQYEVVDMLTHKVMHQLRRMTPSDVKEDGEHYMMQIGAAIDVETAEALTNRSDV
jgi:hypothetical protein